MYTGTNRYVCSVLDEMRECLKVWYGQSSKRHMAALIEEAQTLVNRMEAGLQDIKGHESLLEKRRKLKKEIKKLKQAKAELEDDDSEDGPRFTRMSLEDLLDD